jgi:hypothetical protein
LPYESCAIVNPEVSPLQSASRQRIEFERVAESARAAADAEDVRVVPASSYVKTRLDGVGPKSSFGRLYGPTSPD